MIPSCGETLYFENSSGPRILAATYDEYQAMSAPDHPIYGFFRPYGDQPRPVAEIDILSQTDVQTPLGTFTRVDLSMDFLARNGLDILPPWPKVPLSSSGWAPYRTMGNFCERVAACQPSQPMARALAEVVQQRAERTQVARAFAELAAVSGASAPDRQQAAHERARDHLGYALRREHNGDPLVGAINGALPVHLPSPARAPDENDLTTGRSVWQLRLLYALVLGVHRGLLPA